MKILMNQCWLRTVRSPAITRPRLTRLLEGLERPLVLLFCPLLQLLGLCLRVEVNLPRLLGEVI